MTAPITITLNGEHRKLATATTALDLVSTLTDKELGRDGTPVDGSRLGIAVAIDGEVVRRGRWSESVLADGATVDVVTAVQGG
ncbi:sulfur carrier protein [Brevibacterium sanguinis]|uniref:Sulfur carrier protein n=2 Tax=Brevibacterium TaxID=1696 RepID=A0A366IKD5_9MICO|nr:MULTISPECIES: sulfur carrier protein ThiS [Brevibacterium]RBP66221.1 sulfur carrier protein [Brevibacterium sanguinis]RBP72872.1 sulfur carrier protein [Brevibacterium celere]